MTSGAIHVAQVPESGRPRPLPRPLGCNLSANRKRKPKWRRCVAASIAVGPSAIRTGPRTRPSDWGWNARFGPVEDRKIIVGLPRLLVLSVFCSSLCSPDLVAVTFHPHPCLIQQKILNRSDPEAPQEPCERLERHKPKGLRVVLRGLGSSNAPRLPGGGGGDATSLPDPWGSNPLERPGPYVARARETVVGNRSE